MFRRGWGPTVVVRRESIWDAVYRTLGERSRRFAYIPFLEIAGQKGGSPKVRACPRDVAHVCLGPLQTDERASAKGLGCWKGREKTTPALFERTRGKRTPAGLQRLTASSNLEEGKAARPRLIKGGPSKPNTPRRGKLLFEKIDLMEGLKTLERDYRPGEAAKLTNGLRGPGKQKKTRRFQHKCMFLRNPTAAKGAEPFKSLPKSKALCPSLRATHFSFLLEGPR